MIWHVYLSQVLFSRPEPTSHLKCGTAAIMKWGKTNYIYVVVMRYKTPRLTHLLGRQGKHLCESYESWLRWARCSPCAPGFSGSNLHVCQNLIFMASLIRKVAFCLVNVFFLKNVWLTLSTWCYRLPSLQNVRGCFPSFHNGIKKLRIVTWPSGRLNGNIKNFILTCLFFLYYCRIHSLHSNRVDPFLN